MIDLEGRRAVIAGGAQGIGRAIADRLLASGAAVSLWDRDADLLERTRGGVAGQNDVQAAVVDVTDDTEVERARDETLAALALTKSLAGHDIAVSCITPALAKTRILEQMSQPHMDDMPGKIPRNRFVKMEEVAAMVAWLVSAENGFTTGAVFDLSGGRATS